MEENKKMSFFDTCRLCLTEPGFCDISDRNELRDNVYNCTSVYVSKSDSLTQKICKTCFHVVVKASKLRNIARENDNNLKYIFDFPVDKKLETSEGSSADDQLTQDKSKTVKKKIFKTSCSKKLETNRGVWKERCKTKKGNYEHETIVNLIQSMKPPHESENAEYKCPVCSKKFTKWRKLYVHIRVHKKNHQCPVSECSKKFASKGDLEKHIRTHTGEKPYMCNKCNKGFAQRGTLRMHVESVHSNGRLEGTPESIGE